MIMISRDTLVDGEKILISPALIRVVCPYGRGGTRGLLPSDGRYTGSGIYVPVTGLST